MTTTTTTHGEVPIESGEFRCAERRCPFTVHGAHYHEKYDDGPWEPEGRVRLAATGALLHWRR